MADLNKPLADWQFNGELRNSQKVIMEATRDQLGTGDPLHIVAPPGSGKTLLGLMLAKEQGDLTLALAPTTTVRSQWAAEAKRLAKSPSLASEDSRNLADFTVLTYQMLSVVDRANPFESIAQRAWEDELQQSGRSAANASEWLKNLRESNPKAYRAGILRRSQKVRRELTRQDPAALEEALHPNARELIARIARHGVTTVILDECHHLLDHWALVIRALINRIEAEGKTVTLIGLTATLPSLDDDNEYENYTGLLGEVDYELPTPAVVKEGNLAPYRNFAWFVTPTQAEQKFLRDKERAFGALVSQMLTGEQGVAFLERLLTPMEADQEWSPPSSGLDIDTRLGMAFAEDLVLTEAAAKVLWQVQQKNAIVQRMPREFKEVPSTEQSIRVLARYALEHILPDKTKAQLWEKTRLVLADFGFLLTDKGIRRGRDPVDMVLATSVAKELAIGEILRLELSGSDGAKVRAVAVCDFATHGHTSGKAKNNAGALRAFETVVQDDTLAVLRPVLVTGKHLRIASRDYDYLVPKLQEIFGEVELIATQLDHNPEVTDLKFQSIGSAKTVRAVSKLMATGQVRLIVGTRGLLGEGWDAPSLNTLIDLTAVGTSASTQQLYGRTIRKDQDWPQKVAHNWVVTAVLDSSLKVSGESDIARMMRKLSHLWGISLEGASAVVRDPSHTLQYKQLQELHKIVDVSHKGSHKKVNALTINDMPDRADTYKRWGVGEPYRGVITEQASVEKTPRTRVFGTPLTLEAIVFGFFSVFSFALAITAEGTSRMRNLQLSELLIVFVVVLLTIAIFARKDLMQLARGLKHFALPQSAYIGAVLAIAQGLKTRGIDQPISAANVLVEPQREFASSKVTSYAISLPSLKSSEQKLILDNLSELFEPIKTPRFLLEVGTVSFAWGNLLGWVMSRLLHITGMKSRFFAVPTLIGRRKADAEFFADAWRKKVGPCKLHEIKSPTDMALLTKARRQSAPLEKDASFRPSRAEVWS